MNEAHCLCGAVRIEITLPTEWIAHCHCRRCQLAHGAAFVTWVGVKQAAATIHDPEAQLRWYRAAPVAGLKRAGERAFCGRCGTPMLFRSERWPGELHIARSLFDGPLDRAPQMHAFFDTRVDWVHCQNDLPTRSAQELGG
ncbi:MAG: GFA family protein [Lysobacteraceae bacterium]|jgi:hypothetical protein